MPENTEATETTDAPKTYSAEEYEAVKAEAEKWKGFSRTHEDRSKANLADAEKARQETESAVSAARAEAAKEAESTYGPRLVELAFELECSGRSIKLDKLLSHVNKSEFLKDGSPDREAIRSVLDDLSPVKESDAPAPSGGLFQGARGGGDSHLPLNGDPILQMVNQRLGIPSSG